MRVRPSLEGHGEGVTGGERLAWAVVGGWPGANNTELLWCSVSMLPGAQHSLIS